MVARPQLLQLGLTRTAIQHRLDSGRLHRLWRGVYAVGRPGVSRRGRWMGAVLSCGPSALLSHRSAAELWGIGLRSPAEIEVVIPSHLARRRPGIRVHRQVRLRAEGGPSVEHIPVTGPTSTLIDLATCLSQAQLERAVNEADRLDLIAPDLLREEIESLSPRPGRGRLQRLLDRHTFARTDSGLERKFLTLARGLELPEPETQVWLNGFRVDFFWPQLRLVVEVDGLRYHRTAGEQTRDRRRDQAHVAAGLTTLRFSEGQIRFEPGQVRATLAAVARRLGAAALWNDA